MMTAPILLTSAEAAALLKVSTKTLQRMHSRGLTAVHLSSKSIRYRLDDINDFIEGKCHTGPQIRASGTMTSRSKVVDFMDLAGRKITRKPRP